MQNDSSTALGTASAPPRTNRWNPSLPFIVSVVGSLTFIFAAGTTLVGALMTFAVCFFVAYITQIVFGRFFVALPLFDTVSTTDDPSPHRNSGQPNESK